MRKPNQPGYMIDIGDDLFTTVAFDHETISLGNVNIRISKCVRCKNRMEVGEGVKWKKGSFGKGYLCQACTQTLILEKAPLGYTIAGPYLQACTFDLGRFKAAQVAARIERNRYVQDR